MLATEQHNTDDNLPSTIQYLFKQRSCQDNTLHSMEPQLKVLENRLEEVESASATFGSWNRTALFQLTATIMGPFIGAFVIGVGLNHFWKERNEEAKKDHQKALENSKKDHQAALECSEDNMDRKMRRVRYRSSAQVSRNFGRANIEVYQHILTTQAPPNSLLTYLKICCNTTSHGYRFAEKLLEKAQKKEAKTPKEKYWVAYDTLVAIGCYNNYLYSFSTRLNILKKDRNIKIDLVEKVKKARDQLTEILEPNEKGEGGFLSMRHEARETLKNESLDLPSIEEIEGKIEEGYNCATLWNYQSTISWAELSTGDISIQVFQDKMEDLFNTDGAKDDVLWIEAIKNDIAFYKIAHNVIDPVAQKMSLSSPHL